MYECYTMSNMINKFFTNPGRFIKMFFAITAIVFFAVGPVEVKQVQATAINELFPNAQEVNGSGIITTNVYVEEKPNTKTGDSVTLTVSMVGSPTAKKPTEITKNGKIDSGDNIGAWDAIFDSSSFEKDDSGVFLRISKKDPVKNTYIPIQYDTKLPVVENANHSTSKIFGAVKNISGLFFTNNDYFFNQDMKLAVNVPIYNLEINTTYKFEVFILENGPKIFGFDTFSVEPVLEITTGSTSSTSLQVLSGAIDPKDINKEFNKETVKASGAKNEGVDICGNYGALTGANFYCQIVKFWVNLITLIPNFIAAVVGITTDVIINLSIGHGVYQTLEDFTFQAWKIIRDFSNIVIILSLFIAAFSLILGGGDNDAPETLQRFGEPKKIIVRTILVAIFINFSFFFCRVIIDTGNVTAKFLYNQIGVDGTTTNSSDSWVTNLVNKASDTKQISMAMLSQIQPQKLLTTEHGSELFGSDTTTAYLVMGHMVLLFDLVLIYIFMIMLFLFAGRIVMLTILTILSPLAFATATTPRFHNQKYIGFKDWLSQLFGNAFLATIFLFFIYLSVLFSKIDITGLGASQGAGVLAGTGGVLGLIVGMLFKVSLMFFMLFYGKKIAIDVSGIIGEYVTKAANWATGMAAGAAMGGTAMLARQTVGRASMAMGNTERTGFIGDMMRAGGQRLGAMSFDARNSPSFMNRFNQATNALGGGDIPIGDRMRNEGGYATEGSPTQIAQRIRTNIATAIADRRAAAAETVRQNIQSQTEVQLREAEAEKAQREQEVKNEEARQQAGFAGFRADNGSLEIMNEQLDKIHQALERDIDLNQDAIDKTSDDRDKLYEKLSDLQNKDIQSMKPEEARAHGKKVEEVQKQIRNKEADLGALQKEQELMQKTRSEVSSQKRANAEMAQKVQAAGYQSIAEAEHNKKILEQKAELSMVGSDEEKAVKEKEREYQEQIKKKKDLEDKIKKAKDAKDGVEEQKLRDELKELTQKPGRNGVPPGGKFAKAAKELNDAKAAYKTKKESSNENVEAKKIEDLIKKLKEDYLKTDYHTNQKALTSHRAGSAKRAAEVAKMERDQINNRMQREQADILDNNARNGGTIRQTVGIITGGIVGGENINNAGSNAATTIRNNIRR